MALLCPHCGTKVPLTKKRVSGPVYTSAGLKIRGTVDGRSGDVQRGDYQLPGWFDVESLKYVVAQCAECHQEFVVEGGEVRWPLPRIDVGEEIPEAVRRAHKDAKLAHAVGADIAAVMAARTALVRMQREQKCSNLKGLVERGAIGQFLADQADEVRLWANMTGHEDIAPDTPSAQDVEQLLQYLDAVFDTVYVRPAKLRALQNRRNSKDA